MKQPPQRYKVLRPFEHRGRVYGSGERIPLAEAPAEALLIAGYIELALNGTTILLQSSSDKWAQPVTR